LTGDPIKNKDKEFIYDFLGSKEEDRRGGGGKDKDFVDLTV
jgi:hypothetical protein